MSGNRRTKQEVSMPWETVFIGLCFALLVGLALTILLLTVDWHKVSQAYAKFAEDENPDHR